MSSILVEPLVEQTITEHFQKTFSGNITGNFRDSDSKKH